MTPVHVRIVAMGSTPDRAASRQKGWPVFRQWGSDVMRSYQLLQMIRPHLPEAIEVSVTSVPRLAMPVFGVWARSQPRAIYILLKNVAYRLRPEQVQALRRRAIAIGVDHIDGDLGQIDMGRFDFHIGCNHSGAAALREMCAPLDRPVGLLLHHADPQLDALPRPTRTAFSAVYAGHPKNQLIPDDLRAQVDELPVTSTFQWESLLPRLPEYALHYGVRPGMVRGTGPRAYKPFVKGLTAAACGANIIVNSDTDDAEQFLGTDYPYLVPDPTPQAIGAVFDRARGDFGTPAWDDALQRMAAMRASVSPQNLARQFEQVVKLAREI